MRGDLNICIFMLEESGLPFPPPFPYKLSPCVAELEGWVPWRRGVEPDQGFVRFPTWREGIFVLVFKINKDVMSFFFPNHYSMCDWIYVYDQMFRLIRIVSHIVLIIITLYVVILVWGRYNPFCRFLGARGARGEREDWRASWINIRFAKVWTILISNIACIYLQNYMHPLFNRNMLMAS